MVFDSSNQMIRAAELGQSIWLDYFHRSMIDSDQSIGELARWINRGLRGVTSNPAIISRAIRQGDTYDEDIRRLGQRGLNPQEIYEALAVEDIQAGADILYPVYENSEGRDGYISLEVNPHLARRTADTIQEVRRLVAEINRPNLMIKVPATQEGIPAIQTLTAEGYNINVTLIFSLLQYDMVVEAYQTGLENRLSNQEPLNSLASVASFFVSRIDVMVDRLLDQLNKPGADFLKGKTGIASAKLIYQAFQKVTAGHRWQSLQHRGARSQRVLFGSTSTKNSAYPDTLYPDNLIGDQTVNTLPPDTLEAFLDHGSVEPTLAKGIDQARTQLKKLAEFGIDLDQITEDLLDEGIQKFTRPYDLMLESIDSKVDQLRRS